MRVGFPRTRSLRLGGQLAKHGEGRKGLGVLRHLAYYWGRKDPPAAMQWALALPDTRNRPEVIKRVWLSWSISDREGAVEWLQSQEPNALNHVIYGRYLRKFAKQDPDQALELASRASDPEIRDKMLIHVGQGWLNSDAEAAQAWLAGAGLSPELERQIRRRPPSRRRG